MTSFADIIFLLLVAVFVIVRLYNAFGSNNNDKNVQVIIKPLDKEAENKLAQSIAQIVQNHNVETSEIPALNTQEITSNPDSLQNFEKSKFLSGACRVFEMVLQAFNAGNLESIKGLVNKKIWDALNAALTFRKENNITSEVDFIGFKKSEIKDIKMLKNSVKIVVEFESEQVNILKDATGQVIEGDENFVQKITDVWTFERALNAKNKNWLLVSTKKNA